MATLMEVSFSEFWRVIKLNIVLSELDPNGSTDIIISTGPGPGGPGPGGPGPELW